MNKIYLNYLIFASIFFLYQETGLCFHSKASRFPCYTAQAFWKRYTKSISDKFSIEQSSLDVNKLSAKDLCNNLILGVSSDNKKMIIKYWHHKQTPFTPLDQKACHYSFGKDEGDFTEVCGNQTKYWNKMVCKEIKNELPDNLARFNPRDCWKSKSGYIFRVIDADTEKLGLINAKLIKYNRQEFNVSPRALEFDLKLNSTILYFP